MVAEKQENVVWTCEATCKGSHGERLVQLMCELARVLIISGRSMNIAAFSTQDLREQGCKSYEASYRVNEELVVPRMLIFSWIMSMKVICGSFLLRTIPNIQYLGCMFQCLWDVMTCTVTAILLFASRRPRNTTMPPKPPCVRKRIQHNIKAVAPHSTRHWWNNHSH